MKYILLILFTVYTLLSTAQGIKVQVWDATGHAQLIDYIPSTDVTTKVQRDSMNTSLRSYITGSFNNIQTWANNTFALKGSSTGTIEGQIINLQELSPYKIFKPADYGVTYDDGTEVQDYNFMGYANHKNRNFPNGVLSNTPDPVVQFEGYNSTDAGARKSTKDISMSRRFERRYWIPGMGWCSEYHFIEETMMDNITRRLMSGYYPIDGSPGFISMELASLNLAEPASGQQNAKVFFSVDRGQLTLTGTGPGRAAAIYLKHYDGTGAEFSFVGGVPQLKLPNPAGLGGGSFTYSYGALSFIAKNGNAVYASNAAALAAGFKVGENYYTRINGIRVIAQVE